MMFEAIAFYLFAILTIAMFLIVVLSKNALYSMSALAGGMIFIAAFFFMLNADFMGVVQIIVYGGAVMALYAFGMMFFDTTKDVKENIDSTKMILTLSILSVILLVVIMGAPFVSKHITALYPTMPGVSNPQMVGYVLFTKYLIPFEVAAVLLLVAMIAGIILVSKRMDESITLNHEYDKKIEAEEFDLKDAK